MYDPISGDYLKVFFKDAIPSKDCPLPDHSLIPEPGVIKFLTDFYLNLMGDYALDQTDGIENILSSLRCSGKTILNLARAQQTLKSLLETEMVKRIPNSWNPLLGLSRLAAVYKKLRAEVVGTPEKSLNHGLASSYDEARFDVLKEVVGLLRTVVEPPPVIFLDIDGVLNPMSDYDPDGEWNKLQIPVEDVDELNAHDKAKMLHIIYRIAPRCLDLLNEITDKTGAVIVISSTWRKNHNIRFFVEKGITGQIIGKTPVLDNKPRGIEIDSWLQDHPEYTRFVILDDDNDMAHLTNHLIQTDTENGLTRKETDEILKKLT